MKYRAALCCLVALIGLTVGHTPGSGSNADGPAPVELGEVPGRLIVDRTSIVVGGPEVAIDPEILEIRDDHAAEVQADRDAAADRRGRFPAAYASAVGGMSVSYHPSYPAPSSVRAVVDGAVAHWDSVIATNGSGPIVVDLRWEDLGHDSLLGYAGPVTLHYGGSLPTSALYPAALANTLLGTDANGAGKAEIQVHLNSRLLTANRWYLGTTGSPRSGQIDLYSVVLHEVGHGLGFLGSAHVPSGGSQPNLSNPVYVYDTLARHGSTELSAVADPAAALRSGDVSADVSDTLDYKLYAPTTWSAGSSFSHFDELEYPGGSAGSLMTPMLGSAETARILDSPTLGLMAQMGWPLTVAATTPTLTSASPSQAAAVLGWEQNLWQTGVAPDRYVVQAWRNGTTLDATTTVDGTASGAVITGLVPGADYQLKVVPWGPNGDGAPAVTAVHIPASSGPPAPSQWPTFIRNTALDGQVNRLYQAYFLRLPDQGGFDHWRGERARGTSLIDIAGAFATSQEFRDRYGSLGDGTFVDLVYANVLGRAADASGRAFWLSRLQQGMSRGEVMVGFAESAEYVERTQTAAATDSAEARITRLYRAFFLRDPEPDGLAYWAGGARSGTPLETIAAAFASSSEFQQRYGNLSNAQFVQLVYGNVLGRSADAAGLDYWSGLLAAGVDRGSVMVGFSESAEFVTATGTIP